MGSSLASIMSNIFVLYFETELLLYISQRNGLDMLMIFVFHCLIMKILTIFFNILNDLHPNIRFEYEFEMDGSSQILDLRIHRYDNILFYSLYRKETNSSSYIHLLSAHYDNIKKSVISGQFLRSYKLCGEMFLKKGFQNLGDPKIFIHKCHSIVRSKFYGNRD